MTRIRLVLEPWGETYRMPAGPVFGVVAGGDAAEVAFQSSSIKVCGRPGLTLRLVRLGAAPGALHQRPPVPLDARDSSSAGG